MNNIPFQTHLDFYIPQFQNYDTRLLCSSAELLKIFYIARVIFGESSSHQIKSQTAPLFNRKQIFSTCIRKSDQGTKQHKSPIENYFNLARITSASDLTRLLPREHVLYDENIFYKKIVNHELTKISYHGNSENTVSVDNFFDSDQEELTREQKVYLLFDNSTSMNGDNFKKLIVSKAIALEYLRRVSLEQPQIYFRSFHSEVSDLIKAKTPGDMHTLINHITQLQTGGDHITNIQDAVIQAIQDIKADPELKEAEILVMTDGFGPLSKNLNDQLGSIKLHVILIPDLDIDKILQLYPDRTAWEAGGPEGKRPMPSFWNYYSKEKPPQNLEGDEDQQNSTSTYEKAGKSVKKHKMFEILQGLAQIYTLKDICKNFTFIVVTSTLGDSFSLDLNELDDITVCIKELQKRSPADMTINKKLRFLQTINFLIQLLSIAKSNTSEKEIKQKIKQLMDILGTLQALVLDDPMIQSVVKVDNLKIDLKFAMGKAQCTAGSLPFFAGLAMMVKLLWMKIYQSLKNRSRIFQKGQPKLFT